MMLMLFGLMMGGVSTGWAHASHTAPAAVVAEAAAPCPAHAVTRVANHAVPCAHENGVCLCKGHCMGMVVAMLPEQAHDVRVVKDETVRGREKLWAVHVADDVPHKPPCA